MKIEMELWHLVTLVTTVIGAYWGLARMLIASNQRSIDEKFATIAEGLRAQDELSRRLERDLLGLRAELPRDYVRREDYTQAIATIMTKIDHVALRVETVIREAYAAALNAGGPRP